MTTSKHVRRISTRKVIENTVRFGITWREAVPKKEAKRRILRIIKHHIANRYETVSVRLYGASDDNVSECLLTCFFPRVERSLPANIATRRMAQFVEEIREDATVSTVFATTESEDQEVRFGVFSVQGNRFVVFPDHTILDYSQACLDNVILFEQSEMASSARRPSKPPRWINVTFQNPHTLFRLHTHTRLFLPAGTFHALLQHFESSEWSHIAIKRKQTEPAIDISLSIGAQEERALLASVIGGFFEGFKSELCGAHYAIPHLQSKTRFTLFAGDLRLPIQSVYASRAGFNFPTYAEHSLLDTKVGCTSPFEVEVCYAPRRENE